LSLIISKHDDVLLHLLLLNGQLGLQTSQIFLGD
jgi:hypothetical protein